MDHVKVGAVDGPSEAVVEKAQFYLLDYIIIVSTCDESRPARSRPQIRGKNWTKNKTDLKGVPHRNQLRTKHTVEGMFPAGWLTF